MISKKSRIFLSSYIPQALDMFLVHPTWLTVRGSIVWTIPVMAREWQVANVTSIYILTNSVDKKTPVNCQPAGRIIQGLRFFACQPCNHSLAALEALVLQGFIAPPILVALHTTSCRQCWLPFLGLHPRWWLPDFCSPSIATSSWAIRWP